MASATGVIFVVIAEVGAVRTGARRTPRSTTTMIGH
jgi:hypothetical protein